MKRRHIVTALLLLLLVSGCQPEPAPPTEAPTTAPAETAMQHNERGIALTTEGHYEQAISEFDKAIELNPDYAEAYGNRGIAYGSKGELDRAIADFDKAIELDPEYTEAYSNRGIAYVSEGEFDKAIADFDRAIELDPEFAEAYGNRGIAYGSEGELDSAIVDFDKAIELDPESAKAYSDRGIAYGSKGELDSAIADFDKAIELDPEFAEAYYFRGIAYGSKGELTQAVSNLEKCLELSDDPNLVAVAQQALASLPSVSAEVGKTAPNFKLKDLEGEYISLSSFRGKPVLINFWATWCGPCFQEMPHLQEVYDEWSGKGLVMLAIDCGGNTASATDYIQRYGFSFPVLVDSANEVSIMYGVQYLPTTFLIDRDGVILTMKIGPFPDKDSIEQELLSQVFP